MKSITFALLCLASCLTGSVWAEEYDLVFKSNGSIIDEINLKFEGEIATATTGDVVEQFDVKQMKWRVDDTDQWISLTECKTWAEKSRTKSSKSVEAVPERLREFMRWSLDPKFERKTEADVLKLTSGQIDYVIEGKVSAGDLDRYFAYAELNSYKKAMVDKKLPPFAELKAIEAMKKLGRIPSKITVTVPGVPGAPSFEANVAERKPAHK